MSVTTSAPALRFPLVPDAWVVADPSSIVWTPDLPNDVAFGVLAPALSLDVRIQGEPVSASATVVVTRARSALGAEVPVEELAEPRKDDVRVEGHVDLPIGRAYRVQTFWQAPVAPGVPPGPRASVQYLVPRHDWLVTLTFDTGSFAWAGPLVEVFDEIALGAEWIG